MNAITFDTHAAIKALKKAGHSESQAEAVVNVVKNVEFRTEVATKDDISELRAQIKVLMQITVGLVVANLAAIIIGQI